MNDDRAFERATRDWLEDGSDRTPPAAIDAVLLAVRTTSQERDLRIPWRTESMRTLLRAAAAIAIVLVAAVAALAVLRLPNVGGPVPTSTSSTPTAAPAGIASQSPTPPTPTAGPLVISSGMALDPGTWSSGAFALPLSFDVPASGAWRSDLDTPRTVFLTINETTARPDRSSVQLIDFTEAGFGCAQANERFDPWNPADRTAAPFNRFFPANASLDPSFPTDVDHQFETWLELMLYKLGNGAVDGVVGAPASGIVGGHPALTVTVDATKLANKLAACQYGLLPIARFAPDNWFGIGPGIVRITVFTAGPGGTHTILAVAEVLDQDHTADYVSRVQAANAAGDQILGTLQIP